MCLLLISTGHFIICYPIDTLFSSYDILVSLRFIQSIDNDVLFNEVLNRRMLFIIECIKDTQFLDPRWIDLPNLSLREYFDVSSTVDPDVKRLLNLLGEILLSNVPTTIL